MIGIFNWIFKKKFNYNDNKYNKLTACQKKEIKNRYKRIRELENEIRILYREIIDIQEGY